MTTPTRKSALALPEGYADWLAQLKGQIVQARQRASLSVNAELVQLYGRKGVTFWSGSKLKAGVPR